MSGHSHFLYGFKLSTFSVHVYVFLWHILHSFVVLIYNIYMLLLLFPFSPQLATRLLAHKIQSPQEWEAMQALMVS